MEPLFNAFATAAFFEFVTFAIFEMRWLLLAWRARRGCEAHTLFPFLFCLSSFCALVPAP